MKEDIEIDEHLFPERQRTPYGRSGNRGHARRRSAGESSNTRGILRSGGDQASGSRVAFLLRGEYDDEVQFAGRGIRRNLNQDFASALTGDDEPAIEMPSASRRSGGVSVRGRDPTPGPNRYAETPSSRRYARDRSASQP